MGEEQREAVLRNALAATVRHLREQKGIAQEKLAIESGIGRSHMSRIERGLGNPTFLTIARLLPYLGVTFAQFIAELERQVRAKSR